MRYFLVAGEASGDLHGSDLVRHLLRADNEAVIVCWGGDRMQKEGATLLKHYKELAFMGFTEVLLKARRLLGFMKQVKREIAEFRPDVVILIDYPGFNLRIAGFIKERGIPVYYYISPKIWAWNKSRIKKIKRLIDRMYVIFPFETAFYASYDYRVLYFGNPLVDSVARGMAGALEPLRFREKHGLDNRPVIAILAGSRIQEVKKLLPAMISIRDSYRDYQFVVAGISAVPPQLYDSITAGTDIRVVYDDTYSVLRLCELALVTSGTATLETALAAVPQVVCYITNPVTYTLAKAFLKIRFLSLVNLIMDREVVRELIQDELNDHNLAVEINSIMSGGWKREVMMAGYRELSASLDGKGSGEKVSMDIYQSLCLIKNVN